MKLSWKVLCLLSLTTMLFLAGCASSGGSAGDENDPAATSDEEQMQDETGDV